MKLVQTMHRCYGHRQIHRSSQTLSRLLFNLLQKGRLRVPTLVDGDLGAQLTRTQPSLEPVAMPLLSWLTWRSSTSWRWPCSLHTSEGALSSRMGLGARLRIAFSEMAY